MSDRLDTIRHKVGTCPACRGGIWGDVDIQTLTAAPNLDAEAKPVAYARAHIRAMRVEHHCEQRSEDDR